MVGITIIEEAVVLTVINRHDKLLDIISFKNLKENENVNININNINIKGIISTITTDYVEKEVDGETIKLVEKSILIKKL